MAYSHSHAHTPFPASFVVRSLETQKALAKKPKPHIEANVTVTLEYSPACRTQLTLVTDRPCFPMLNNARRLTVDQPKLFKFFTGSHPRLGTPVFHMHTKAPNGLSVMFGFGSSDHDLALRDKLFRLLTDFFNQKLLSIAGAASDTAPASPTPTDTAAAPLRQSPRFAYKDSPTPTPTPRSAHSAAAALAAFHSSSSSSSSPSRPSTVLNKPPKRPASPTCLLPNGSVPPHLLLHDPIGGGGGGGGGGPIKASKRSRPNDEPMGPPRPPPIPVSSLSTASSPSSSGRHAPYPPTSPTPISPTPPGGSSAAASLRGLSTVGAMGAMDQFKHQAAGAAATRNPRHVAQGLACGHSAGALMDTALAIPPAAAAAASASSSYFDQSRARTGALTNGEHPQQGGSGRGARRGRRMGMGHGRGGPAAGFASAFGEGPGDARVGAGAVAELSGMRNNGNTCYQNALLVAFLATPPFMAILSRLAPIDRPLPPDLEGPFVSGLGGGTRSRPRSASVPPRSPSPNKDLADAGGEFHDTRSDGGRGAGDEGKELAHQLGQQHPRHELVKAIAAIAWKWGKNPGQPFTEGLLNLSGLFKRGEQADAQELLTECLAIMETESPPIGPSAVNLFQFTLAKRVQCDNCPYHSTMTEPHRGLSLEVPPYDKASAPPPTSSLLHQYFAPERIEYKCERCAHPTASVKHFVHRPPHVLVLHLKRFQMMLTGQVRKKHEPVAIQEVVDLAPFAVPEGGHLTPAPSTPAAAAATPRSPLQQHAQYPPPTPLSSGSAPASVPPATPTIVSTAASPASTPLQFRLHAVVNHLGQHARRGHYVCDMRDPARPDYWLTVDDSHVSRLGNMAQLGQRRGQHGYLLFYVQVGDGERGEPSGTKGKRKPPVPSPTAVAVATTPQRVEHQLRAGRWSPVSHLIPVRTPPSPSVGDNSGRETPSKLTLTKESPKLTRRNGGVDHSSVQAATAGASSVQPQVGTGNGSGSGGVE